MKDIRIKLKGRETNRTQPFIMIGGSDTYEMIYDKFMALKEMGIYSAVLQYTGSGRHEENAAADVYKRQAFRSACLRRQESTGHLSL